MWWPWCTWANVGLAVGTRVDGTVGVAVGERDGECEGTTVGELVGARVGNAVGVFDGANDGPLEVGGFVVGISARHSVGRDDFGTCHKI